MWSYDIADIIKQDFISYDGYSVGGGWTTYYTVKGLNSGTTYIRFTYARDEKSGFNYVDVYDSAWYRVDVDEQNYVTITEITYAEFPESVDLPQITSSPAVMASCYPDYSMPPEETDEPAKTPEVSASPVIQGESPKETVSPVFTTATPQVSTKPVQFTEEPKETDTATQFQSLRRIQFLQTHQNLRLHRRQQQRVRMYLQKWRQKMTLRQQMQRMKQKKQV